MERKAGKVELINPGITENLAESHLLIDQQGPQGTCLLFRAGDVEAKDAMDRSLKTLQRHTRELSATPVKRAASLVELLAWVHFNRLHDSHTLFALDPPEGMVEQRELNGILEAFEALAHRGRLPEAGRTEFDRPPVVVRAAVFINVGIIDPLTRRTRQGIHLSSDQLDVFSYGSRNESLVETLDLVLVTNRREVLTFRYRDEHCVVDCLRDYLSYERTVDADEPLEVHCFATERGSLIARRFAELVERMSKVLAAAPNARFVLRFRRGYYLFQREEGALQYRRAESLAALLLLLAAPRQEFSPVVINAGALQDSPLPLIYAENQPGKVQFFYQPHGDRADVYIVDERGSLYFQTVAFASDAALLSHYQRFFAAVLPRRNLQGAAADAHDVAYYAVLRPPKKESGYRLVPQTVNSEATLKRYFSMQVIAEALEDRRSQLTVYCDDSEFSSLEHGERLFMEIAGHVLERRKNGERYPIYITDIDITRLLSGAAVQGGVQTIHFLSYKKRIEDRLNDALKSL